MAKDEIENKRLLKTYGITLAEYRTRHTEQSGRCAICSAPMCNRKLNVDHCHKVVRTKIVVRRIGSVAWAAQAFYTEHRSFYGTATTRRGAQDLVKKYLLQRSIRGLLCWRCNKGLAFFSDSADRLQMAACYLQNFYDKLWEGEAQCQPQ